MDTCVDTRREQMYDTVPSSYYHWRERILSCQIMIIDVFSWCTHNYSGRKCDTHPDIDEIQ
jgi:hypothetical protein